MSLDALIMLSGAFVAVLPFLGFPNSWDRFFFLAAGIFIVALGIIVRRRTGHVVKAPKQRRSTPREIPRYEDELAQ